MAAVAIGADQVPDARRGELGAHPVEMGGDAVMLGIEGDAPRLGPQFRPAKAFAGGLGEPLQQREFARGEAHPAIIHPRIAVRPVEHHLACLAEPRALCAGLVEVGGWQRRVHSSPPARIE